MKNPEPNAQSNLKGRGTELIVTVFVEFKSLACTEGEPDRGDDA